jgi:hypothetical protein
MRGSESVIVSRQGDWITAEAEEQLLMMSVNSGAYLCLSTVGRRIWELTEQPIAEADLVRTLLDEFEVEPEVCAAEVQAFLAELQREGAITRQE